MVKIEDNLVKYIDLLIIQYILNSKKNKQVSYQI